MASPPKNTPSKMGGNEDDALLKDIDFGELGESGATGLDEARPLPKKVELDIDDMILEDEKEPPETTEPEPTEGPALEKEPEPEPEPAKFSRFKLALLAMAAILVLAAVAVPVIIMTRGDKSETETVKPANALDSLIQAPFVINFPGDKQDIILKMTVAVSFPNQAVQQEFQTRLVVIRDLIFRYALGAGFDLLNDQASRPLLSQELAQLINEHLKQGTIKSVDIIEIVTM